MYRLVPKEEGSRWDGALTIAVVSGIHVTEYATID